VRYSGDSSLSSAASAPFTVRLVPQATAVSVTSTNRFVDLYPAIVGAHVGYTAHVTAAHGVPAGIVTFFRDATRIGQASVGIDGTAGILVQADTVWSGDIVARFTPASTRMAGSEGELAHSWVKAPVAVTVSSPSQVVVGAFPAVTVDVRLLWEEFPFLNGDLLPDGPPSGTVTVSDGLGTTCEVALTAVDDLRGTGSCVLSYGSLGARSLTATYEGDDSYVAATSAPASTTVMKGDPEVSIVTPDGAVWAGRTSIPVAWSVAGPSSGSVTIALGGDVVCTSTSLVGACDVAVPAYGRGHHDDETLTLTYSGDPLWNGRTATTTGTVIACVPLDPSTVTPDGRGTVTLSPAPTCGGGTGYWTTDFVQISVVAQNGYRVASISNQGWPYPDGDVFRWDGGRNANLLVHPERLLSGDTLLPMSIRALIEAQCIPVTIGALGIASRTDALNAVPPPDTPRACGDSPARAEADGTWTVMLPVGSTVDLRVQPGFAPQRTTFYGWSGVPDDVRYSDAVRVTIAPDQGAVWARFGPVCYTSVPTLAQPASGGTLRMSMPAPNCSNPRTGATGWVYDTPATGELVDDGTIPRSFFDGWGGDTSRYRPGTATTRDVGGVRTTVRPFTFSLRDSTFAIGAAYGRCYAVSTSVRGDASSGVPGTVSFGTASNCPLGAGSGSERWYREGTSVSLTAASTGTTLRFLGWSGLPIDPRSSVLDATVAFPLTADVTAAASFGTNANCRPFSLSTVPAGSLDLETTFALGPNACEAMYGPAFYDQGTDGNGILVNASPATPEAEGAEIVFAWATSPPGSPSGQSPTESDIWDRTTQLNEGIYGSTQIVAYACQFVAVAANVTSPSGRSVPSAGATNVDRASQSSLAGFVGMPAADCASGSDPASGYGGYAWTVGSQLLPIVTADPVAYRFTGWSGDVAGTGETPDAPLTLAGPGRRAQGEEYHRRIVANFQAICHTLSLPSDADKLEVITAPNCPGTDASQRMYLGGTDVVLHATDRDDTLFRNWVSGTDEIDQDDAHWASVTMTSDRTVVPYYSAKSASEQITEYGAMAGDLLAVASKKALGFATATMSAYLKTLVQKVTLVADGIGYLAQGLEALGVHGAVIDGMKNASTMVSSMISMLWAPFDCLTAWSAGGEDTAFFAAQNLLGTALVATMSTSAAQQQAAAPTSTFQQLKAKAQELKAAAAPVKTGVSALQAAKSTYDAAASGSVGWESSAYDAWGSQASAAVFTSCLSGRATGVMDSMDSVLR